MGVSAREHFDWAIERAYGQLADEAHADPVSAAVTAMSSVQSDLNKHPGTTGILDLRWAAMASLTCVEGGRDGMRRILDELRLLQRPAA